MKMKPLTLAVTLVFIMLGGILISDLAGVWVTSGTAEPALVTTSDNTMVYDPADIKGSYTLKQVSSLYQVPIEELLAAFSLNADKADIKCKDLEKEYDASADADVEIGPPSIRLFVALYKQLPYNATDEFLPAEAVSILKQKAALTEEQIKYLDTHTYTIKNK